MNAEQFDNLIKPINKTIVIGPPNSGSMNNLTEQFGTNAVTGNRPGSPPLFFDLKNNLQVQRGNSYLFEVTCAQIPVMEVLSLADLYLTKDHIREPHWHPNADEFDYVVSGEATVSILNPFTLKLHNYHVKPGQVAFIPEGWWHWITPVTDNTHLLVNFNDGKIESVEGSDVFRLTTPAVFQHAYGINSTQFAQQVQSINQTLTIGPPNSPTHWNWL
jgi:mannose-6-phosphate isomerase-like protein (cupin superfamily)